MLSFLKKRQNKTFYLTALSQILIAAQLIMAMFGHGDLLTDVLQNKILAAADAILVVLATFGVINDPTQPGTKDREL